MLHDRSDRVSGDEDHLWSDTTLIRYIDHAQRRFARRSLCLRDATSPATRFTTVPYQSTYQLDPSIISIYSIRSLGNGMWVNGTFVPGAFDNSIPPIFVPSGLAAIMPDTADLARGAHASRYHYDMVDTGRAFDVNAWSTLNPGKPLVFDTDETMGETPEGSSGVVSVTLYPQPDTQHAGCIMQMRVARLPVARLTPKDLSASPEIGEDYHLDMLDWAAHLALRIVDHELGDPARAAEFKQSFAEHVEEARLELQRKTFAPQPWGFGRNGFTYQGN